MSAQLVQCFQSPLQVLLQDTVRGLGQYGDPGGDYERLGHFAVVRGQGDGPRQAVRVDAMEEDGGCMLETRCN